MMLHKTNWVIAVVLFFHAAVTWAQVNGGRITSDRNTFSISLVGGTLYDLDGEVRETTRPIEVIGGPTSQAPPENYSWSELGFDDSTSLVGLRMEKMWRYFTLQLSGSFANPTVRGVADRNFFIGVESVSHSGEVFEYMVIPEGTIYNGDIRAYMLDTRLMFTPVSFGAPDHTTFTPWIHLGLFGFWGDYYINAGDSRGVTVYENPPRDYVIRGRGEGDITMIAPEVGIGAELRIPISRAMTFNLQGHVGLLKYAGSTGDFGISARNEKGVDIDYLTYSAKVMLEIALNKNVDLIFGAEIIYRDGEAEVRAKNKSEEQILALREKFDKDVTFNMTAFTAFVGLQF